MPWSDIGHLDLDPVIKTKVLQGSAATIDRVLGAARAHIDGQRKRRKGVGSAIRRSVPVRTFADWLDPTPCHFEIDMVEHCGGPKTDGDFVHTLTLTDIASGMATLVSGLPATALTGLDLHQLDFIKRFH